MRIYITGDKHRDFRQVYDFCVEKHTSKEDLLLILGDAGINYYLNEEDTEVKELLQALPIKFLCIHGNHEQRPYLIPGYLEKSFLGGSVYYEPEYPDLLFAKDGEIYLFQGKKFMVIGGAYSIDKYLRQLSGRPWFASEQADEFTKKRVEEKLEAAGWKVDCLLTHAAPTCYEPTWAFIPGFQQELVDKSMVTWLQTIEEKLEYKKWFFGHYHVEHFAEKHVILYHKIYSLMDFLG